VLSSIGSTRAGRASALIVVLLLFAARAAVANDAVEKQRADNSTQRLPCHLLDPDQRHPKAGQLSVGGFGGSFLGASVGSSYAVGARAIYFVTRLLGLGVGYTSSRLANGHDLGTVDSRAIHLVNGQLELSVDTTIRITAKTVLEIDLFGTFGGGAVSLAGKWDGMGVLGGGVRAFTGLPWLAVRIDVVNFLHRTRRIDGTRFESNVAVTLGLSFLLPPRRTN
jgi:hypothetical protein